MTFVSMLLSLRMTPVAITSNIGYELSKFVRELCVVLGPCNSDNERIMRAFLRDHLMMVLIPNFLENFLCHRGLNKRIIVAMRR